jgi:xanthine dehydrogenase molybdopterin-binding subunit B
MSALVNIYPDGSTRLETSGVEMGQGLNVKIAQVIYRAEGSFPLCKLT